MLHHLPRRFGMVDRPRMRAEARRCLDLLDLDLDPDTPVAELSVAQAQLVEIAKALPWTARCCCSTSRPRRSPATRPTGCTRSCASCRDSGHAVVLVSHKLEEVFAVADTVTVLRDGRSVAEAEPLSDVHPGPGRRPDGRAGVRLGDAGRAARRPGRPTPALRLSGVSTAGGHRDVSLTVRPGEILGLYGLVGAGRSELAKALLGLDRITAGTVEVHGEPVRIRNVGDALRRYRIGYVTENRKEEGLFLDQPITRNIGVTVWRRHRPRRTRHRPRRAAGGRRVHRAARHPGRLAAAARRPAVRRQPAEGEPGEVARRATATS